ncbi:MAG: DUF1844 domain-containing protein [Deltaproteobacteria bacterium]|nr:DUF1844 domain-containing protein [Deltaproteobacteria bacterium]MBI4796240.1 DUF1844 domain-containing protein [Deltaproteobacteria bacterium]
MSEEEKAKLQEEEAHKAASGEEKAPKEEAGRSAPGPEVPLPEITFSSFLFSLSTAAFVNLGAVPDPATGGTEKNLPLAKQTIDLLGLLREKTRNNLSREEEDLFDHLLYDLRMRYIKEAG